MLEILEVPFKPMAYRYAARTIENLPTPIEEIDDLESLPGVGKNLAKKIREIIETGHLKYYEKLKKQIPFNYEELMSIEGMGPKKIKKLYRELGIKNLEDLKKAAEQGKIRNLEGFGEKSEKSILRSIELYLKSKGRILLNEAFLVAESIIERLKPFSKKIHYAGSLRRMKETIGDIDILAVADKSVFNEFLKLGEKIAVGPSKATIHIENPSIDVDLRVIEEDSWGAALQYFTGSKQHNISLRKIAIKKGYKLNEYGLFKGSKKVAGKTEKEIYDTLGVLMFPPEMRENTGEIEAKKIPDVLDYNSIKGDLQMHTKWSDGVNSPEEMIEACINLGYEYVGITDHAGNLAIANALSPQRILSQVKLFKDLKKKFKDIQVLHGIEVNIDEDGKLDVSPKYLKLFDYVVAGIHTKFKLDEKKMTERLTNALSNDYLNILAHPTGRMIGQRDIDVDIEKVIEEAVSHKKILEINAQPRRLDLRDIHVRMAVNKGASLVINTDAHDINQLYFIKYGIAVSRRGWAEKKNVINTLNFKDFRKYFFN